VDARPNDERPADAVIATRSLPPTARAAQLVEGNLASGALWLLISNMTYAACQWGALVAISKMKPPVSLGHFGLAMAVATPVVMVTGFALRAVQATDVQRRYTFAEYLTVRLAANVAAAVIMAIVVLNGFERGAALILIPLGVAKLAEATSESCYGLSQLYHRMRFVALSKLARGALGLIAMVTVVTRGGTLAHGTWALAAAWTAFLIGVDLPAAAALEPVFARPRLTALRRLTADNAPLGAVHGAIALTQSVPRYLLAMSHGAAAVGYFTAIAALVPALDQIAAAFGHAAAPRLGWAAAVDRRRFRVLLKRFLGMTAALSLLLATAAAGGGEHFLHLAYTADYAQYRAALVLVTMAAGFTMMNTISFFALVARRRPRMQLAIQCVGLLATAASAALLVPRFSVTGAAAALAFGGATMAIVSARILLRADSADTGSTRRPQATSSVTDVRGYAAGPQQPASTSTVRRVASGSFTTTRPTVKSRRSAPS